MNGTTLFSQLRRWITHAGILLLFVFGGAGMFLARPIFAQVDDPEASGMSEAGLELPAVQAIEDPAAQAPPLALHAERTQRVHLPLLAGQPRYSAQFARTLDANQNPIAPDVVFPRGTTEVFAVLTLNGAAGKSWRVEWYRNNLRVPGIGGSGTIPSGQVSGRLVRKLSYANNGALPAGNYSIVLYISESRALEAAFEIK